MKLVTVPDISRVFWIPGTGKRTYVLHIFDIKMLMFLSTHL